MSDEVPKIPIISQAREISAQFEAWICDIWGVLHNGVETYAPALDACARFRAAGGTVILVSNAPRPSGSVIRQLSALGVPAEIYDRVLTSGDVAQAMLAEVGPKPVLHIGPDRDLPLFEGLAVERTTAERAEMILCSGLYDDTRETAEDYTELLRGLAQRGVPMLCANPDIKVDRGGSLIYCAGALGARYSELGGRVSYAGKPHAAIYVAALGQIERLRRASVARQHCLAIGDGVETDIRGGVEQGIPTLYVPSAVHLDRPFNAAALDHLFPGDGLRPNWAAPRLAW